MVYRDQVAIIRADFAKSFQFFQERNGTYVRRKRERERASYDSTLGGFVSDFMACMHVSRVSFDHVQPQVLYDPDLYVRMPEV